MSRIDSNLGPRAKLNGTICRSPRWSSNRCLFLLTVVQSVLPRQTKCGVIARGCVVCLNDSTPDLALHIKGDLMSSKSYRISSLILAILIFTSICGHASKQETIQAQAFGTTTMAGKSFGVTINIEDYSTPADQKALIDAFNSGGHDEMVKVLSKMKSKGRVRLSSGGVGYQISYIRNIQTANGRRIRLLTDRPIGIGEAMFNTRSGD